MPGSSFKKNQIAGLKHLENLLENNSLLMLLIHIILFRSSRPEVFCKKGIPKNFPKFTGKHLCQSLFFTKVAGLTPATLLKRDSGTGVFLQILRNF